MCDTYDEDETLSRDTNALLRAMHCMDVRRQLGHCIVRNEKGEWNVPGLIFPAKSKRGGA